MLTKITTEITFFLPEEYEIADKFFNANTANPKWEVKVNKGSITFTSVVKQDSDLSEPIESEVATTCFNCKAFTTSVRKYPCSKCVNHSKYDRKEE